MLDDLIELAHAHGLVNTVALEPDGYVAYQLRASPRQITVWVRPDGRFSRASADGELLTLGQVMNSLVAAIHGDDAQHRDTTDGRPASTASRHSSRGSRPALRR